MLKSYSRRAFLLFAIAALEPAASNAARADDASLWDVLSHTTSPNAAIPGSAAANPAQAQASSGGARMALGPVPGYSLPAPFGAQSDKGKKRSGIFGPVGTWFDRLQALTGSKVKATGSSTLSFRKDSISGSGSAFQTDQYFGQGSNGIYTDTDMTIDATLFKWLHYSTRISNSLFQNPNDKRVKLDYKTKKLRIEWGDINAGFQGNSLIDFNRYLSGIQIHNEWSRQFRTTVLWSQVKAETRTIVINGNNSSGPYYVYAGQIVEGSDQVRVDNKDMVKGTDYTLDTYTGQLNFLHNNVILSTSTIAISYETYGAGGSSGSIVGG